MMRHAGKAFVVMAVVVVLLAASGPLPIIGVLGYALLPTAAIAMIALGVGVVAQAILGPRRAIYCGAVFGTLALLTAAGVQMRRQAEASGRADVHQHAQVARVVTVGLREPVSLQAVPIVHYDDALFDAVMPTCGDSHCFSIRGLGPRRILVEEVPSRLLEDIGLKPGTVADARLSVRVTQASAGDRTRLRAEVIESGAVTATLDANLPDYHRPERRMLSAMLHYWLEDNPLVAMLRPRPQLGSRVLASFLRSALHVKPAGSAPRVEIDARELHAQPLVPPLQVDRKDPRYIGWWWSDRDPRCEGVLSVEGRPGVADYYVTFLASPQPGPQLRISTESLICAGDAVYVSRYGRTPPDVLDLARYSLSGQHIADLRIKVPAQAFNTFIAFEDEAVTERGGVLEFDVRHVRFEWAQDATGQPIRDAEGRRIEYAIISRVGRYAATLPPAATAPRD